MDTGGNIDQGKGAPESGSFDHLVALFAVRCLNAPLDQLGREIEQDLYEVNSFFGGDRVLLWEFSDDGLQAQLIHSHAEAGSPGQIRA